MNIKNGIRKNKKYSSGIGLLEILVVISIFAVLGIITTRSVLLTLQGSKKTESTVRVRENLNFAMGVIERNLRNANKITVCPNPSTSVITYIDTNGNNATFSCVNIGTENGYVASGSASLTNTSINVKSCQFVCEKGSSLKPDSVSVSLEAVDKNTSGIEGADVVVGNKIFLRNY